VLDIRLPDDELISSAAFDTAVRKSKEFARGSH